MAIFKSSYGEFIIEIRTVDGIVVDRFGREVLDGAPPWTQIRVFKRKPNQYADSSFTQTDWDICADCLKSANSANDTPYDWGNVILPDTSIIAGYSMTHLELTLQEPIWIGTETGPKSDHYVTLVITVFYLTS